MNNNFSDLNNGQHTYCDVECILYYIILCSILNFEIEYVLNDNGQWQGLRWTAYWYAKYFR